MLRRWMIIVTKSLKNIKHESILPRFLGCKLNISKGVLFNEFKFPYPNLRCYSKFICSHLLSIFIYPTHQFYPYLHLRPQPMSFHQMILWTHDNSTSTTHTPSPHAFDHVPPLVTNVHPMCICSKSNI
ncbi:hypothetical protein CR513_30758, partial [Mucuna pruriens]